MYQFTRLPMTGLVVSFLRLKFTSNSTPYNVCIYIHVYIYIFICTYIVYIQDGSTEGAWPRLGVLYQHQEKKPNDQTYSCSWDSVSFRIMRDLIQVPLKIHGTSQQDQEVYWRSSIICSPIMLRDFREAFVFCSLAIPGPYLAMVNTCEGLVFACVLSQSRKYFLQGADWRLHGTILPWCTEGP